MAELQESTRRCHVFGVAMGERTEVVECFDGPMVQEHGLPVDQCVVRLGKESAGYAVAVHQGGQESGMEEPTADVRHRSLLEGHAPTGDAVLHSEREHPLGERRGRPDVGVDDQVPVRWKRLAGLHETPNLAVPSNWR
jgi:hypothetical protein